MNRLRVADYFTVPELPVTVLSMPAQGPMALHRHEFAELAIITGGSGSHLTAQGRYPIAAGDVFFIPPEEPHGYADTRSLSLSNVLFLPRRLPPPTDELQHMPGYQGLFELEPRYRDASGFAGHLRLPPTELDRVMELVRAIGRETRTYVPGGMTLLAGFFLQLLVLLARSYGSNASVAGRRLLALEKTIRHIDVHYQDALELEELAKLSRMSLSTFKRAFKAVTGTSPIDYLLQARLKQACHLLRDPGRTVTEAALAAGFNDSNYFARQFRRRMGQTPRDWRATQTADKTNQAGRVKV